MPEFARITSPSSSSCFKASASLLLHLVNLICSRNLAKYELLSNLCEIQQNPEFCLIAISIAHLKTDPFIHFKLALRFSVCVILFLCFWIWKLTQSFNCNWHQSSLKWISGVDTSASHIFVQFLSFTVLWINPAHSFASDLHWLPSWKVLTGQSW